MDYIKSPGHQIEVIAQDQIKKSNAPSIKDVFDFSGPDDPMPSSAPVVSATSSLSATPVQSSSSSFNVVYATEAELSAHEVDINAHASAFAQVTQVLLAHLSGSQVTDSNLAVISGTLSTLTGTYLRADHLVAGTGITIASGSDSLGPTRTVSLDISKGILSGAFSGTTSGIIDTGIIYSSPMVVNASVHALTTSFQVAPLIVYIQCYDTDTLKFDLFTRSASEILDVTFDIHWTMI